LLASLLQVAASSRALLGPRRGDADAAAVLVASVSTACTMNVVTARQIKAAQKFEDTVDRGNDALVNTLKQACSRNRAIEKQDLWKERHEQDHGSKYVVSLKSKDGEVHRITKVPTGANVTQNDTNKYAEDRKKYAAAKEDLQLRRFCDGQDTAWRPDSFFVEECGDEDLPPWPVRPTELFTNPHLSFKVMAEQMERQKLLRKAKKMAKKELKAENKDKVSKKDKKDKKDKKLKKEVKKAKKKLKKAVKKEKKQARREKQEDRPSKKPRKETCSAEHEEEPRKEEACSSDEEHEEEHEEEEEQAAAEMEGEDSEEAVSDADGEGDEVVSVHLSSPEAGAASPSGEPDVDWQG